MEDALRSHPVSLEAKQRYFSIPPILVVIASQDSFVLAFLVYCTIMARYVGKMGDSRESIRRRTPIFIALKRFERIAFKLRFAIFIRV